jgi:rhodanese-related sulfurtransferase
MEAPRISKEELKSRLDKPDTIVIDVRRNRENANKKIKNAVLEDPDNVNAWAEKYEVDDFIVLYCA